MIRQPVHQKPAKFQQIRHVQAAQPTPSARTKSVCEYTSVSIADFDPIHEYRKESTSRSPDGDAVDIVAEIPHRPFAVWEIRQTEDEHGLAVENPVVDRHILLDESLANPYY